MRVLSPVMLPLVALMGLSAPTVQADSIYGTPRQYYSGYTYVPSYGYGYRTYYFKPTADYAGYDYHYVIYPQHDPDHAYYYNPHKQSYWGRCPSHCHGEPYYSLLPPSLRKPALSEIPQTAFPKPGPLPPIPGAKDGTTLDLAPDDTPATPAPAAAALPAGTPPPAAGAAPPPAAAAPPGVPTAAAPPADAPPAVAAAAPVAQ